MIRFLTLISLLGCASGEASIHVTTNEPGTFDADWTGDGGSVTESFTWQNPDTVAEYDMDIDSTEGSTRLTLLDADGEQVASVELQTGKGDDSTDGISSAGAAGAWTITIEVTDFVGDGSVAVGAAGDEL